MRGPALRAVARRAISRAVPAPSSRVLVIGNHIHLIVEQADAGALATGMQGLEVSLARRLNFFERRGALFADRYHARVLKTPREAEDEGEGEARNARARRVVDRLATPRSAGADPDGGRRRTAAANSADFVLAPAPGSEDAATRRRGAGGCGREAATGAGAHGAGRWVTSRWKLPTRSG